MTITDDQIEKVTDKLVEEDKKRPSRFAWVFPLLVMVLLISGVVYWVATTFSLPDLYVSPDAPREQPVVPNVPEPVAPEPVVQTVQITTPLAPYIDNPGRYANQKVTVVVYLRHGTYPLPRGGGIYTELLVDDDGTELLATGLTTAERQLFPTRSTTENLYEVAGIFRDLERGPTIDVSEIVSIE